MNSERGYGVSYFLNVSRLDKYRIIAVVNTEKSIYGNIQFLALLYLEQ